MNSSDLKGFKNSEIIDGTNLCKFELFGGNSYCFAYGYIKELNIF